MCIRDSSGHKWADVTDDSGEFGASILNDSKYGWDAIQLKDEDGNVEATRLRLTALRSPMGAAVRCSGWDPAAYYIDKTLSLIHILVKRILPVYLRGYYPREHPVWLANLPTFANFLHLLITHIAALVHRMVHHIPVHAVHIA